MTTLWVDAPTGLAGDMLLAGLLDLGIPISAIEEPLNCLGLAGCYRIDVAEARSGGLRGKRVSVMGLEDQPPHRHWADIRQQIVEASLPTSLKDRVLAVFTALAEAESTVHGSSMESVHFHEVGAVDALVDVVGVCAALDQLNPARIFCSPLPAGRGTVRTAHGLLPVPVPAVLELARRHQVPLQQSPDAPEGELVTPTGLALMAVWADRFVPPARFTPALVGVGLGHRELDRPNLVRLILDTADQDSAYQELTDAPRWQSLVVQEAWLDDATPEDLALLMERLREAGAVDVAAHPLVMKKGRCGHGVIALVEEDAAERVRQVWFNAGTSIGVRERRQGRWLLPRRSGLLDTPWGMLPAKQVRRPDGRLTVKPEADDLELMSRRTGCSVADLRAAAVAAPFISEADWSW
ncbi:MAG: nickel pincer cofactor biosynthesis protein LarC [Synechococcus sp. BS307-5m-G36]|nr:nickel pincer cofactor biosynthesis protein LarC [Synechococcus sp. BS307-5m-G36]